MNKSTLLLTVLYIIIIVYFAIFNWNIFVLELDINLGVKVIQAPLIAVTFLMGIVFFLVLWLNSWFVNLLLTKKLNKTKNELYSIKASQKLNVDEKLDLLSIKIDSIAEKLNLNSQNSEIT